LKRNEDDLRFVRGALLNLGDNCEG
jgi:hypothetical protein